MCMVQAPCNTDLTVNVIVSSGEALEANRPIRDKEHGHFVSTAGNDGLGCIAAETTEQVCRPDAFSVVNGNEIVLAVGVRLEK